MAVSYTERTIEALTTLGYDVGIVERYIANAWHAKGRGVRKDLFGFIDLIAMRPGEGIIGVQSTGPDYSGHNKKIVTECREKAIKWLKSGGRLELWAWRKVLVKKGGKLKMYKPRIKKYTLEDFREVPKCQR